MLQQETSGIQDSSFRRKQDAAIQVGLNGVAIHFKYPNHQLYVTGRGLRRIHRIGVRYPKWGFVSALLNDSRA